MDNQKVTRQFDIIKNHWVIESIRSLRNRFLMADQSQRVFCVSSLYPKEGVSTIVRLLALSLGDINKKVIVVSTNLKYKDSEVLTSCTLKDYLSNQCSFESIVQNIDDRYDYILGSNSDDDYSDLLYLLKFTLLIKQLKADYDFVLIDSPNFSMASEATMLSQLADSLVLVVKEYNVKIDDFSEFCKKLKQQNITIKGVVINRVSETENLEISII